MLAHLKDNPNIEIVQILLWAIHSSINEFLQHHETLLLRTNVDKAFYHAIHEFHRFKSTIGFGILDLKNFFNLE